jgi:hypothetical protein
VLADLWAVLDAPDPVDCEPRQRFVEQRRNLPVLLRPLGHCKELPVRDADAVGRVSAGHCAARHASVQFTLADDGGSATGMLLMGRLAYLFGWARQRLTGDRKTAETCAEVLLSK